MLKSPLFYLAPALLLAATIQPKTVTAAPAVRIVDITTYQIAPAPGAPKLLVHVWSAPRKSPSNPGDLGARWVRKDSPFEMAISPFVYDIFSSDGKKGWNYLATFVHQANRIPEAATVRYLNNVTKTGYIFEVKYSDYVHRIGSTIYTFPDMSDATQYSVRSVYASVPTGGYRTETGFGRDARGYAQLVSAEKGRDTNKGMGYEIRTISSWDENKQNWKAEPPITIYIK